VHRSDAHRGSDIQYTQGLRAGPWLFFTGHMAGDFEHGLAATVAGKPGLPLGSPPRYRREGDFIIDRFAKLIAAEGGDLRHIVRVDQYYPRCVPATCSACRRSMPPTPQCRRCAALLASEARGRAHSVRRGARAAAGHSRLQYRRGYVGLLPLSAGVIEEHISAPSTAPICDRHPAPKAS
jgi:hypothetical protein